MMDSQDKVLTPEENEQAQNSVQPEAVKEVVEEVTNQAEEAVEETIAEVKEAAEEVAEKAEETVTEAAETTAEAVETAAEAVTEAAEPVVEETPVEEPVAETPAEETPAEEPAAEPVAEETPAEAPAQEAPEAPAPKRIFASEEEVLERTKELAHGDEPLLKEEIDHLKTAFYRLHLAKREAQYKAYIEGGGDPDAYQPAPDVLEESFKAEMGIIREKRAKEFARQEAEKEQNLKRKEEIIEKIKLMASSPDAANKSYQEFRALQQEWKEIKNVPATKASELWRTYQLYVEQFYDQLKLNSEAREYDFKKNLQIKTQLCEAAEKLADEPDVISAFHQLQKLHQQFRETGPVAKDLREEIWTRFKAASTVINKRHQQHFEQMRSREEENLAKKTNLCEQAEEIAKTEAKQSSEWERLTKQLLAIQAEWKTIGFAPQKMNVKIFERFRAACDSFFSKKAEYFKTIKQQYAENADKKRALVEKAKALMDSTDWKKTSDQMIQLQKQWKTIGMAPRKLGDKLWDEFTAACNHFFEARNAATGNARSEEHQNLDKKKDIVAQLKTLLDEAEDAAKEKFEQLTAEYQAVGHVPYKEKDNIYNEYRTVLDELKKKFGFSASQRRLDNFKSSLRNMAEKGEQALDNERVRLLRQYDQIKSEVQTYENNLGFLNASSKKGNTLVEELKKKVEKLKEDLELVKQKVRAIDAQNKEQAQPKETPKEAPKETPKEEAAEEPKAE